MQVHIGIDLGGTGSRFVAYGARAVVAQHAVTTAALCRGTRSDKLARLAACVRHVVPPTASLAGVGIGASGPVDPASGIIRNPDTLAGLSGFAIVSALERRLGVPVTIDNDAMVAAIAEHRVGAGRNAARLLVITLGTGIGVALLVDGRPFRGLGDRHPEASHIPIASAGGRCYCGITGCWEHLASRTALQAMLRPLVPADTPDAAILAYAARHARRKAILRAFFDYGALLGRGLIALHALYMPDRTVIGGSAAACYSLFAGGLKASIGEAGQLQSAPRIRVSTLGDTAGALGAALLARDAHRDLAANAGTRRR